MAWPELEGVGADAVLAVPLGSVEQHGHHLPLDTDTRIATALAAGLAVRRAAVLVAPALAYGASGEHADFPGTLSIGAEVLSQLLVELVRSAAQTFARTVLINAHGGNARSLATAEALLRAEGHDVRVF